ncbi:MAG: aminotransferase class V-fold PLP-dependent enzyme [Bacteriovoracaceae bacterium]|nr:aminotransferase class V-fold PLP-dependent enzyme [Bacteriovoracaceae bacterium]
MDRIYLDFNATSPLAPAVHRWLTKGDFFWANPSSQHSSGKKASFALEEARRKLQSTFKLDPSTHQTIYHSGATESINSFVLGWWFENQSKGLKPLFVFSPLDHACVRAQAARLKTFGCETLELTVQKNGNLDLESSLLAIKEAQSQITGSTLLNFTWVHNETGVVWPLSVAEKIKAQTGCRVHVDAAQVIGKVANCFDLSSELDLYSFSSHKCGGLKSHGWSFVSSSWSAQSLILGGGQQQGLRAGTENVIGALALEIALEDLKSQFNPGEQKKVITELRDFLDTALIGKGERICRDSSELNLNTALFVINALPSDMSLPLFDLAGLELSAGAACSSGAAKASPVLEALGLGARSRNGLRLSTSWGFGPKQWEELRPKLGQVLEKLPLKSV